MRRILALNISIHSYLSLWFHKSKDWWLAIGVSIPGSYCLFGWIRLVLIARSNHSSFLVDPDSTLIVSILILPQYWMQIAISNSNEPDLDSVVDESRLYIAGEKVSKNQK